MTNFNVDLRLWLRTAIVGLVATTLGAVIGAPWLGLIIIPAIALTRRGQILLLGTHTRRNRQPATHRWNPP